MGAVLQFIVKASFGAEQLVVFFLPSGDSQPSKGTSLLRFAPKVKALIGFLPPWEAFCDQMLGHDEAMEHMLPSDG